LHRGTTPRYRAK